MVYAVIMAGGFGTRFWPLAPDQSKAISSDFWSRNHVAEYC